MAQFDALAKQYKEEQNWLNYRAALICAVVVNAHKDPKKGKTAQPKDFMPKDKSRDKKELTGEEMMDRLIRVNAAFGGEVK